MSELASVVITVDGAAKCGKTAVTSNIAEEARYYSYDFGTQLLDPRSEFAEYVYIGEVGALIAAKEEATFDNIVKISAGNAFRAATLYTVLLALKGEEKTEFTDADADELREMLSADGMLDVLQHDAHIATSMGKVDRIPGVQRLCGTIFSDAVKKAYNRDGGSNLVVADARDPIGHLLLNDAIGTRAGQIDPATIVPIYVEAPAEDMARRMQGDFDDELEKIQKRRIGEATRKELPVTRPTNLIEIKDYKIWRDQFDQPIGMDNLPAPLLLPNHGEISLPDIQGIAGRIAVLTGTIGDTIRHKRLAVLDN